MKIHYTGASESPAMADQHRLCVERVRAIQDGHMGGNGWSDIGYTALACLHGFVFQGRGPGILPASNGPGLNAAHYGVCGLVGDEGVTRPNDLMLHALRDAIEWLRREGAGDELRGHRDGYDTTCPGEPLYAWVRAGAPRPGTHHGGDEMPEYVSVGVDADQELAPGSWHTVSWDKEWSDKGKQHPDKGGAGLLAGPAAYALTVDLRLSGIAAGAGIQVRAVEAGGPLASNGPIAEFAGTDGDTFVLYAVPADKIQEGAVLQVNVQHFDQRPVRLISGAAKLHYWR